MQEPPKAPRFIERTVPVCPVCRCLVRRDLGDLLPNGQRTDGPWRCDLHGEQMPMYETYEVPVGDDYRFGEEEAYDPSDPKHPRHHEVYADIADSEDQL